MVDIMIFDRVRQNATFLEYVFFTRGEQGRDKIGLDKEFAFFREKNRLKKKLKIFLKKGLILWEISAIMHTCMNTFGNRRCNHAQH